MSFRRQALDFLMENKLQNSKEWFEEHREIYEKLVLEPMRGLVLELSPAIHTLDEKLIAEPRVGRSISRIYRDTRFTKDKTTFRDVVWCTFRRDKKLYEGPPAFYFEFSPQKVRWGCGYYRASSRDMAKMRELIGREDPDFYAAAQVVAGEEHFSLEGERYKRSKFPAAQGMQRLWLDQKSVAVTHTCCEKEGEILFSPDLGKVLTEEFQRLRPVYHFFRKVQTLSLEESQQEQAVFRQAPRQEFDW